MEVPEQNAGNEIEVGRQETVTKPLPQQVGKGLRRTIEEPAYPNQSAKKKS